MDRTADLLAPVLMTLSSRILQRARGALWCFLGAGEPLGRAGLTQLALLLAGSGLCRTRLALVERLPHMNSTRSPFKFSLLGIRGDVRCLPSCG